MINYEILKKLKAHHTKTFSQPTNIYSSSVSQINAQIATNAIRPYFENYFRFYSSISPLGTAIDIIADQFSSIQPKIYDTKNKEYSDDHPLLQLLKNPNPYCNYNEFSESMASFFELTGNQFWRVTKSKVDGEPIEIYSVPATWVGISTGTDGNVWEYTYSQQGLTIEYVRNFKNNRVVYESKDGRSELIHLKHFNPASATYLVVGLSKLNSIFYELEQFRLTSLHNQSLLANGARPSGLLKAADGMTEKQANRLRAEFTNMFSNAQNAGRPIIASNVDWQDFTQTNRDMDFATLKAQIKELIYNRLNIPLALVNSDSLSLANMEEAMIQLYSLAVLPLTDKLFDSLSNNLLPYYKGSENLILTYDPSTIEALKVLNIQEVQKLATLNIFSDNELRNKLDATAREGGDEVFKPSTMIPVGTAPPISNTDELTNGNSTEN